MQTTYVDDLAVITELIDTGNEWDGLKVHLATAVPALAGGMQVGDFTEATFTGSAAKAITWGTPFDNPDGSPKVASQLLAFQCTADPTTPETITGIYITDTAGTGLKFASLLDTPVSISAAGQGIPFVIGMGRYSGEVVQV